MMDFAEINTGTPVQPTIRNHLPAWFLDMHEDSASDADLARDYGHHMIWQTKQPVKLETVRKHVRQDWAALGFIADLQPEIFDEVICAIAERALLFENPDAA